MMADEKNDSSMIERVESTELDWSPEEEKKLVRKIDMRLLPMIWIMYLLSYMDRTKLVGIPIFERKLTL